MKNTIHKFTPAQQEIVWDLKQKHLDYQDRYYKRPEQERNFLRFVERFYPEHTELAQECKGVKFFEWYKKQPA